MDIDHYNKVFQKLEAYGFEINKDLEWTFFFFSSKKASLQNIVTELDGFNYTTVIVKFEAEYKLTATKKETLTPHKLARRNIAFKELANFNNVLYDGWEVSKEDFNLH